MPLCMLVCAALSYSGSRLFAVQVWQCIAKTGHWYVTELLSVASAHANFVHRGLWPLLALLVCINSLQERLYWWVGHHVAMQLHYLHTCFMDAGDSSTPPHIGVQCDMLTSTE
jgi:hypothetical protein